MPVEANPVLADVPGKVVFVHQLPTYGSRITLLVPGFRPALAMAASWGVNQQVQELSLPLPSSVTLAFQINNSLN